MKALEWITKEAKKLRKDFPKRFATWKEYVAQASAIYASKHKGKSPVGKKKIGAIKIVEKGESKNARPKAVYEYSRSKKGTFKGLKKIGATKSSSHKDTKSHNVNIRVVSGIERPIIGSVFNWLRINNDINGNPRYVMHFMDILNNEEKSFLPFNKSYEYALKKAKKIGGKKYHNKQYGGGIVFQSYNIDDTEKKVIQLRNTTPNIKY